LPNILIYMCIFLFLAVPQAAAQTDVLRSSAETVDDVSVAIAPWGVDLDGMEKTVEPGDDFYRFANGNWEKSAIIAPGKWSVSAQSAAQTRTDELIDRLIDDILDQRWPKGSEEAKFVNLYKSYTDRRRLGRLGTAPLRNFFSLISGSQTHAHVAELLGSYQLSAGGLFKIAVRIDPEGERAYLPSLEPADLLLGGHLNYLRDDPHIVEVRREGVELLSAMLGRAGQRRNMRARAQAVVQLETELAALYPTAEFLRDPSRDDVFMSVADLQRVAPDFPWQAYFRGHGIGEAERIHVRVWQNLEALAEVFAQTPTSVWRDYMRLRLMSDYGAYLSDGVAKKAEALESLRRGVPYVRLDTSRRAARLVMRLMPDVVGRAYLRDPRQQDRIAEVKTISEAIRESFRTRILAAEWPTQQTKVRAIEKLDAVEFIIGGPPGWNNFAAYTPNRTELFNNVYLARQNRKQAALGRLYHPAGQPRADLDVLRSRVFFSPLKIGAYYLPRLNTVLIPSNYLQAPFYDPSADMAVNFGALGTTIGHELGHAFDDQGSHYGADGQLEDWWAAEDRARFDALGAELSAQFESYEAVPGLKINTALTLGENLSDLVGLEVAYQAYETLRAAQGETAVSKQQGMRRFLLGYTQKRKAVRLPNVALELALDGAHSPPVHRVNGIVRNLDFWYEAYGVHEEHKLWLAPEDRIKVW